MRGGALVTGLDEALAEARKTLELCAVDGIAPPGSAVVQRWRRIEAALVRAQRVEAAARSAVGELDASDPDAHVGIRAGLHAALAVTP